MTADGILAVVGGGFGALALIGYIRAFTGMSGTRRAVRVPGRVLRVDTPPVAGGDSSDGIPVVIAFRDAASGQELALPTTGVRHGTLTAAWVDREVGVRYPPGKPHRFTLSASVPSTRPRGLVGPTLVAVPAYAALLVRLGLDHGWGWGPLGGGLAFTALMCWATVAASRERARRGALLAAALIAPGRVVAVQEHTTTDDDGTRTTTYVPVVAFTTYDGRTVTGQCRTGIRDPRRSLGTTCPVHYAPDDPSVFTANPVTDRRALGCGVFLTGFVLLGGVAVTLVGVFALL